MPSLDLAIVGAGPVGATVAALSAAPDLRIGVFEARPAPSGEPRILALSHASRMLLEDALAWPASSATPIASSVFEPPRKLESTREPVPLKRVKKASVPPPNARTM